MAARLKVRAFSLNDPKVRHLTEFLRRDPEVSARLGCSVRNIDDAWHLIFDLDTLNWPYATPDKLGPAASGPSGIWGAYDEIGNLAAVVIMRTLPGSNTSVSYATTAQYRNRGIGPSIVKEIAGQYPDVVMTAFVPGNAAEEVASTRSELLDSGVFSYFDARHGLPGDVFLYTGHGERGHQVADVNSIVKTYSNTHRASRPA